MAGPVEDVVRTRVDRCPGVLRPWPAEDGALVRLRLPGGRLTGPQLRVLADAADALGDGDLHLTSRANVQLRAVRDAGALADRLEDAGLLPSRAHDLVRNLACSPFTGLLGGRADLRPVLAALDAALLADERLAALPGKFLLALDDGSHDVAPDADLAAVALDDATARLVVGGLDAGVVPLIELPDALLARAHRFLDVRGDGPDAPWHVRELPGSGRELVDDRPVWTASPATGRPVGPLVADDGTPLLHVAVPDGRLGSDRARDLSTVAVAGVVVTPWRTLVLPGVGAAS